MCTANAPGLCGFDSLEEAALVAARSSGPVSRIGFAKRRPGRGFEPEVIASQPFRDLFLRSLLPRLGGGISTGLRQEGFLMVAFGRLSGSQIRRSGEAIPRAGLSTRGRAVKVTP